jgi:4-hydroxybutyrate CoA-transferase
MRADVDYVVTEFGVAKLKGKALRERAFALLDIADPKFRDEIVNDLEALKGAAWLRRRQATSRKA